MAVDVEEQKVGKKIRQKKRRAYKEEKKKARAVHAFWKTITRSIDTLSATQL